MRYLIYFIIFFLAVKLDAQKISLKGDVNTSDYPELEFVINVYDPEIKKQNDLELKENNVPVAFSMEHLGADVEDKSKAVLILIEDMTHQSHSGQREAFREILEKSLPDFVKKGDRVNVAVFDRNRDGSTPLRFLLDEYTDDSGLLVERVKNYEVINDHFSRQVSSDLYNAIYDGISELKNKFPKQNKILLVFSAGKNLELSNYNSIETLNQYAKKEKVAVYSMQYMLWEHETIDVLARESFGKFFHIQGPFPLKGAHDNATASDSLASFMNGAVERLYGHDYRIKYNTTFEEDGKLHYVTVSVDNDKLNVQFTAQACGIVCLFKKQPWLFGGIILVVVVLTVLLISFSRKKKKEKEEKFQKEIDDAKKKAGDIERQLDEQKKEAEEKERQRKLSEEKQQKDAAKKAEEEELLRQMKMAGVLPVLQDVNSKSEYKINRPLLLFGRKAGNDYIINDTYVSGQHFKIFFKDGFYFIEDLNSSNGTKVNGRKITNAKLNHNDIVEVGSTKHMFRF